MCKFKKKGSQNLSQEKKKKKKVLFQQGRKEGNRRIRVAEATEGSEV